MEGHEGAYYLQQNIPLPIERGIYPKFTDFTEKIRDFFKIGVVNLKDMLKKRINDYFQKTELNPLQNSTY